MQSINLYPSLGFFEGTTINAGRGTENQFQQYGAPFFPKSDFSYTPHPNFGSKYPKHNGELCNGVDLKNNERLNFYYRLQLLLKKVRTVFGEKNWDIDDNEIDKINLWKVF